MIETTVPAATIGRIPVRNLWLLMLYASRFYRTLPTERRSAAEDNPDEIPDLVAEILTQAVERRLRRNLSAEFDRRQDDLTRVRGRIDPLRTERRQLLQRGRIACSFDELATDTPRNRYVRAALNHLHRTVSGTELKRRCRITASALERAGVGTDDPRTVKKVFSRSQFSVGRTNAEDGQMLSAAELAFNLTIPTEDTGLAQVPVPDREARWVRRLFEAAVGGFYDTVLSPEGWRVRTGSKLNWQIESPTAGVQSLLPGMTTDIILEHPAEAGTATGSRLVIDTKFTSILGIGQYGNSTLHSGYIYQIYAYLRSQEMSADPPSLTASGMLLHPSVGAEVDEAVTIQGHRIRFATVDLAANSTAIRNRLLALALDGWP